MNGDKRPVVAFCYDFDRTLTPDDMQAQGYIQDIGYDVARFWEESNRLAAEHAMDRNLAYMYRMVEGAEGQVIVNRKALMAYGGSRSTTAWTAGFPACAATARRKDSRWSITSFRPV